MSAFLEFVRKSQLRFYQERDLGLDLYHAGWPGIVLGILLVASAVVFLLAIFQAIPARRHVVGLLLGLGLAAGSTGFAASYLSYRDLPAAEPRIIRESAGPLPASEEQKAAVVALPLVVGALTLAGDVVGCLYMAAFWALGAGRGKRKHKGGA
ncbi:MAG: hypothetical protein HY721_19580 [Planctomycetes bacterium]|nr:hypothetical protein [Planctomycetota bacterium]